MEQALNFLKNQKLLTLATHSEKDIWIANVYFVIDEKGLIYFISPQDTRHSLMILKNPNIAFSAAWFDRDNHQNRKSIQGLGNCHEAKSLKEITTGIKLLYQNFPDLRDILTIKWIMNNAWGTKVWIIRPSYMKYWDDEIYGEEESEEFNII